MLKGYRKELSLVLLLEFKIDEVQARRVGEGEIEVSRLMKD